MIILLIGLAALYLLWNSDRTTIPSGRTAVVVTEGYDPLQLETVQLEYGKESIFRTDLSPFQLPNEEEFDSLLILGYGLPDPSMIKKNNLHLDWNPPQPPGGLVEYNLPDNIFLNKPFNLEGRVVGSEISHILFKMDNQIMDTVTVSGGTFSAKSMVTTGGNHLLQLIEADSNFSQLVNNPVDIVPQNAKPLRFILMSNFPSAEMRFLKEHLAEDGHSIISRALVSRDSYSWDFINWNQNRDVWSELGQADLIIMDQSTFQSLNSREYVTLLAEAEEGLGILIRMDGDNIPSKLRDLNLPTAKGNYAESFQAGQESIDVSSFRFTSGRMNGLIHSNLTRKGKITFSLIKSTYPLLLYGDSSAYREIWSNIILQTARTYEKPQFDFPPVYEREIDQRMNFGFYSSDMPDIYVDNNPVPIEQDLNIPERWNAAYWPKTDGWHKAMALFEDDSVIASFYVPDSASWRAARSALKIQNNRHILGGNGTITKQAQPTNEISPFFWLSLFVLSFGFLWLEPRL